MAEPDGGLALVAVLAAGPRRLERAHVALPHELVVAQPQVVLVPVLDILLLLPLAAAGPMRAGGRGGGGEGEGGEAERRRGAVGMEPRREARDGGGAAAGGYSEECSRHRAGAEGEGSDAARRMGRLRSDGISVALGFW